MVKYVWERSERLCKFTLSWRLCASAGVPHLLLLPTWVLTAFAVQSVEYSHGKEFVVKENVLTFLFGEGNMKTDIINLNPLGSIMAVLLQYGMSNIYLCGNNTFIVMTP